MLFTLAKCIRRQQISTSKQRAQANAMELFMQIDMLRMQRSKNHKRSHLETLSNYLPSFSMPSVVKNIFAESCICMPIAQSEVEVYSCKFVNYIQLLPQHRYWNCRLIQCYVFSTLQMCLYAAIFQLQRYGRCCEWLHSL